MANIVSKQQDMRSTLIKMQPEFKAALPKHISVDKFIRTTLTAIMSNPDILEANKTSVLSACMKACQDGLIIDGKESAIVTFKTKQGGKVAQYMPMVAGILKKMRNSGEIASITTNIVYKNDKFKYWVDDTGEHIEHEPTMFGDRGDRIGVYAIGKTKEGSIYIEILSKEDVSAIKSAARSSSGPWSGPFEAEMWKKSAIRRLSKRMPMSTDLEMVVKADDDLYEFNNDQEEITLEEKPVNTKAKKLEKIIEKVEDDEDEDFIIEDPPVKRPKEEDLPI